MSANHDAHHHRALDFWLARGAILFIIVLQLLLINDLSLGPRWLAPTVELGLLLPLSFATAWIQRLARRGHPDEVAHVARQHDRLKGAAVTLTAIVSLVNFAALAELIRALLSGNAGAGETLLVDALNIWTVNMVVFALWFWDIDAGGPRARGSASPSRPPDFLFPQMTMPDYGGTSWVPGFVDYLFLSFTNATAFSPTDTLPLSRRAKLLMMAEASVSLLTVALVAARAVNILK